MPSDILRIAFLSYEYPPDTGAGGIGTYTVQAGKMLSDRGHQVHIFSGTTQKQAYSYVEPWGVQVKRIPWTGHDSFRLSIAKVTLAENEKSKFDVVETPDWRGDGLVLKQRSPKLPLVIKLHTSTELIARINQGVIRKRDKLRAYLGAWKRGRLSPSKYLKTCDPEYQQLLTADEIATPSLAIADLTQKLWGFDTHLLSHVPYPFAPSDELLSIPPDTQTSRILFVGRLEPRKGVLEFADAIPTILSQHATATIRFVGLPVPMPGGDMRITLQNKLVDWKDRVEFLDPVPNDKIPGLLREADICVFPSRWENFPLVCLEAMSAARGIVGSQNGGMAEQLGNGKFGMLINPKNVLSIAESILRLLRDPAMRVQLGKGARQHVLDSYSPSRIVNLQEASYARAIERCAKATSSHIPT